MSENSHGKEQSLLPKFLPAEAKLVPFSDEDQEYERSGSATTVHSFDCPVEVDAAEVGINPTHFVVKKYNFPNPELEEKVREDVFGKDGNLKTLEKQASLLKERHNRVIQFFQELPALVLPTQFILYGNSREDAHIYEVQERMQGLMFYNISWDDIRKYISQFSSEQRLQLKKSLEIVIRLFSEAIEKKSQHVPDMNFNNFGIRKDASLCLIDTNRESDWSQDLWIGFVNHQKRSLKVLEQIMKECS